MASWLGLVEMAFDPRQQYEFPRHVVACSDALDVVDDRQQVFHVLLETPGIAGFAVGTTYRRRNAVVHGKTGTQPIPGIVAGLTTGAGVAGSVT